MSIALPGPDLLHNDPTQYSRSADISNRIHNVVDYSESYISRLINKIERKITQTTYHNIPVISYLILTVYGYFLIRLTFQYHKLYTKSSLIATIITNLVLYGIADTLAQSITAFLQNSSISQRGRTDSVTSISSYINNIVHLNDYSDSIDDPESLFVDYGDTNSIDNNSHLQHNNNDLPSNQSALPTTRVTFNLRRFVGFMFWGFLMAFVQVVWYSFLNHMYTDMPTFISVLERVLTDQLCFSPISLMCFFTYGTLVIEKGELEDVKEKLYKLYLSTLACNYALWFPVQFINFLVMPKKLQVPFSSAVGVLWNCFLSLRNASKPK